MAREFPTEDDAWVLVDRALRDPKWDFRTVEGIARETGLSEERVERLLHENADKVRRAYVTDRKGRLLFTFKGKDVSVRETVANTVAFLAKSAA